MIRRSLGAALWTLVGLLAGFLGALSSLVGTGAGRALLARVSEGALRQAFTGTVEIGDVRRSEEHTSELQSRLHLVCRLLLEKKKKKVNRRKRAPRACRSQSV